MIDDAIASRVRALAEVFSACGLARLTMKDTDFELELRRSALPAAAVSAAAAGVAAADAGAGFGPVKPADVVTSDLVGVVRLARPQVGEGQQVDADRELAFVEALGIRNPVRSRSAGKVAAVFVSDGQPVEYGQPLFAIER